MTRRAIAAREAIESRLREAAAAESGEVAPEVAPPVTTRQAVEQVVESGQKPETATAITERPEPSNQLAQLPNTLTRQAGEETATSGRSVTTPVEEPAFAQIVEEPSPRVEAPEGWAGPQPGATTTKQAGEDASKTPAMPEGWAAGTQAAPQTEHEQANTRNEKDWQDHVSAKKAAADAEGASGAAEGGEAAEAAELAGDAELGPAGVAKAAVDEGVKATVAAINSLGEGAKRTSDVLGRMADNDNAGAATSSIRGMADAIDSKWNPALQIAAAGLKTMATVIDSVNSVVDSFVFRGKQLQDFSPQLTASNAMADVRSTMSDIKEANELGDSLAHLTDASSKLAADVRELLLPIKNWIIETLAGLLDFIRDLIRDGVTVIKEINAVVENIPGLLLQLAAASMDGVESVMAVIRGEIRNIRQAMDKKLEADDERDAARWMEEQMAALRNNILPGVLPGGAIGGPLRVPLPGGGF